MSCFCRPTSALPNVFMTSVSSEGGGGGLGCRSWSTSTLRRTSYISIAQWGSGAVKTLTFSVIDHFKYSGSHSCCRRTAWRLFGLRLWCWAVFTRHSCRWALSSSTKVWCFLLTLIVWFFIVSFVLFRGKSEKSLKESTEFWAFLEKESSQTECHPSSREGHELCLRAQKKEFRLFLSSMFLCVVSSSCDPSDLSSDPLGGLEPQGGNPWPVWGGEGEGKRVRLSGPSLCRSMVDQRFRFSEVRKHSIYRRKVKSV